MNVQTISATELNDLLNKIFKQLNKVISKLELDNKNYNKSNFIDNIVVL